MKKKVLVLCTNNSCRSQMAEGILRHYGKDKYEAFSAGIKPTTVNPIAVKVMKEMGIDISGQRSKHVDELKGEHFDYVITVCDNAKEACPVFPDKTKVIHWGFPDPPHEKKLTDEVLNEFRKIRDLICDKFKTAVERGIENA